MTLVFGWNFEERGGQKGVATRATKAAKETPPTETPLRVAIKAYTETLIANGWVPNPRMNHYQYYDDGGTIMNDTALEKTFEHKFGVSKVLVRDLLYVYPAHMVRVGFQAGDQFDPPIYLIRKNGIGHPHARADGQTVCYHSHANGRTLLTLPPEGMGVVMAAITEQFYETTNPESIANMDHWRPCYGCKQIDLMEAGFWCPICETFWCANCNPKKKCLRCPGPIETPEGLESWQYVAQRFQWPPSAAMFREVFLIGAGVTGSWAALVLNRTFATVHVADPDTVAHPTLGTGEYINRGGTWNGRGGYKNAAIERPIFFPYARETNRRQQLETAYVRTNGKLGTMVRNRFGADLRIPAGIDLLVLCLDTAQARIHAVPTMARKILDIRGTPTSVVFWGLPGIPEPIGTPEIAVEVQKQYPIPPADQTTRDTAQGFATEGYICEQCNQRLVHGEPIIYWHVDGTRQVQTGGYHGIVIHTACEAAYREVTNRPEPRVPVTPERKEEDPWWTAWRRSLEGYDVPDACGEHHDAVNIAAGTVTARFLSWWIPAGMPVGLWEIPFAIENIEGGAKGATEARETAV
jgi:hypothetical protein